MLIGTLSLSGIVTHYPLVFDNINGRLCILAGYLISSLKVIWNYIDTKTEKWMNRQKSRWSR